MNFEHALCQWYGVAPKAIRYRGRIHKMNPALTSRKNDSIIFRYRAKKNDRRRSFLLEPTVQVSLSYDSERDLYDLRIECFDDSGELTQDVDLKGLFWEDFSRLEGMVFFLGSCS